MQPSRMREENDAPHRIRFDEIAVFVEVAATGSLAAAARRLGVPKSTVGRAVARVEHDLGVALVRRMAHGPPLTEAGQRVAAIAAPHVGALRDLSAALESRAEEIYGTLRVTAPPDVGTLVLAPLVAAFVAQHPRVHVELDLTMRVVDLAREGFDAAVRIARRRLPSSSLVAKRLARLDLGLYAGATYAARRGLPKKPEDLPEHEHVLFDGRRGRSTLRLESPKALVRVPVRGRTSANDFFFLREAIAAGTGIGPLPRFVARADLAAGRLVRVLPEFSLEGSTAYLVHPPMRPIEPRLRAFRAFVLDRAPSLLAPT